MSGLDQIGGEADLLSCLDSAVRLVRLIDGANKHSQILGTGGGGIPVTRVSNGYGEVQV